MVSLGLSFSIDSRQSMCYLRWGQKEGAPKWEEEDEEQEEEEEEEEEEEAA